MSEPKEKPIPSTQVSLIFAEKVMVLLGEVPWYTAKAALEICLTLQRESESRAASLLRSQYLQRSSEEMPPSGPDAL